MRMNLDHAMLYAAMRRAGVRPEILYAFDHTGHVVSEDTLHLFTPEDLAEWQAAIDEYRALHP